MNSRQTRGHDVPAEPSGPPPSTRAAGPSGRRIATSFSVAGAGFRQAWRSQPNLRLEALFGVAALLAAAWLRAPAAPIVLACVLVLSLELLNSAIESIVDLVSPDFHPLAGAAKDLAAAAVLTAAVGAAVVGLIVLGPPLVAALRGLAGRG